MGRIRTQAAKVREEKRMTAAGRAAQPPGSQQL
jgi:hypothetical protein